jgi:hypothetical protein
MSAHDSFNARLTLNGVGVVQRLPVGGGIVVLCYLTSGNSQHTVVWRSAVVMLLLCGFAIGLALKITNITFQ